MTERLYYTDSYRTEFDADLLACTYVNGKPALVLDRTVFYPTSGGQPYDTGLIDTWRVIDVTVNDGQLYHIVADEPPPPITQDVICRPVHGQINWPRRYDHMQQHSGQHLISQVFYRLFGYETVSVHFGDTESTLDLDVATVDPASWMKPSSTPMTWFMRTCLSPPILWPKLK